MTGDNRRSRVNTKVIAGLVTAWIATWEHTNVTISCDIPVLCSLLGLDTLILGLIIFFLTALDIIYPPVYQAKIIHFSCSIGSPKTKEVAPQLRTVVILPPLWCVLASAILSSRIEY